MLEQQDGGIERERAREPDPRARRGVEFADGPRPRSVGDADFGGERRRARADVVGRRLDLQRERHREILNHGEGVEQHGARAHDSEAIDRGEPVGAVGDGGGWPAEQAHRAGVGQRRAGHEVDEDFRHRLIEADDRDLFGLTDGELLHS